MKPVRLPPLAGNERRFAPRFRNLRIASQPHPVETDVDMPHLYNTQLDIKPTQESNIAQKLSAHITTFPVSHPALTTERRPSEKD